MITSAPIVVASVLLAAASASASTKRPPVALTASPAHVVLAGSGQATIRVTNSGSSRVIVDVRRAGFSLDLRGRPKIVSRGGIRAAASWLTVRPRRLALRSGAAKSLTISSRLPRGAEPGDHNALVLLTTRPRRHSGLAVRMRLGVVVDVRAPGKVVRLLALRELRVRRVGSIRLMELLVANRGNVTEALARDRVDVSLRHRGRVVAKLRAEARKLLPRTRGIVQFRYRGRLRGWVTALTTVSSEPGVRPVRRAFRIRL